MDFLGEGVCLSFSLLSIFYLKAYVKFKICNFKQNIGEIHSKKPKSIGKSIEDYGFYKSKRKTSVNQKSQTFAKCL